MITIGVLIDNAIHKVNAHGFYFEDGYCVINCINGESIINAYQLVLGCTSDEYDKKKAKNYVKKAESMDLYNPGVTAWRPWNPQNI